MTDNGVHKAIEVVFYLIKIKKTWLVFYLILNVPNILIGNLVIIINSSWPSQEIYAKASKWELYFLFGRTIFF